MLGLCLHVKELKPIYACKGYAYDKSVIRNYQESMICKNDTVVIQIITHFATK